MAFTDLGLQGERLDSKEVFGALLERNRGVFVGEEHNSVRIEPFMSSSMRDFQTMGVKHLFMEMGKVEDLEAYEAFNNAERGTESWDTSLKALIEARSDNTSIHGADNRMDMMIAAREAGIKVFPIDYERGDDDRITVNSQWAETISIRNLDLQDGERYIVFAGFYHSHDGINGEVTNLGVDRILDIPSVDMDKLTEVGGEPSLLKTDYVSNSSEYNSDFTLKFYTPVEDTLKSDAFYYRNHGMEELANSYDSLINNLEETRTAFQDGNMQEVRERMTAMKDDLADITDKIPAQDAEYLKIAEQAVEIAHKDINEAAPTVARPLDPSTAPSSKSI